MPTIYAIPNGRTAMEATTYTSTGTTQAISNADNGTTGFKPDFVWIKPRNYVSTNLLFDSIRGVTKYLESNSTNAETTDATNFFASFNSNGYSQGTGNYANGNSIVGWQWQAGQGTTSNNISGTITSTVSANTTAGFSIVKYTGTGSSATVGHGLGATPSMIIVKSLGVEDWFVYHVSLGGSPPGYMKLNTTGANGGGSSAIFPSAPTSTVFSEGGGSGVGANGVQHIAYCWAPIPGFSSFGYYIGNGSADGPFVYTGFRPKFILIKNSSDGGAYWAIWDSSRDPYNPEYHTLFPNVSDAEVTNTNILDGVSNGFKIRTTATYVNTNGNGIIYAAFAENPFKYANAR